MLRKIFFYSALAVSLSAFSQEQQTLNSSVPLDSAVCTGVLENGMTYYIRANMEPKDRASFYMIQNVGAILEEDNQNGLAHFLEHMAFNGTEHFPEKGIINTLEKHGVAFGRNINAYTAKDETVYNISNVPVGPDGLLDTCLMVLHDWSDYLLLTEEEIDAERGVISEEWRTRRNSGFRLSSKYMPVLVNHSKYGERDVIGDLDIIKNFKYDELRQFYHDWYRTDLQAIAVVGDFDAAEMEKKVIAMFSEIPAVENPMKRYFVEIPCNDKPMYVLATDKEATNSSVALYIRHKSVAPEDKDLGYMKESLMESLAFSMVNARISELLQKGTPPFISGRIGYGGLTRKDDVFYISATAKDNEEPLAFKTILTEAERVRRFGFTGGELKRAKLNLLTSYENALKRKDKTSHDRFCSEYKSLFLNGEPSPGIEYENSFAKSIIPQITIEELNTLFAGYFTDKNRVIVVTGPDKEELHHLTEQEALAIISEVENDNTIEPYKDEVVESTLVSDKLPESSVVAIKELPMFGAVEWTLSNNTKVVYCFADYNKDKISFSSYSKGGSSLYEVPDLATINMMAGMMGAFGVGEFDAISLKKALTGKSVNVSPSVSSLSEAVSGSSRKEDFETMLQLAYLYFEHPRFDDEAYKTLLQRYRAYIANQSENPQKIMSDSLSMILSNYNSRTLLLNDKFLDDVSFDRMKEIYGERFDNGADFIFFIVGDIPEEDAKRLSTKYLGAISSNDNRENWIDREEDGPEGELYKKIPIKMAEPKSTVVINYGEDLAYTPKNRIALSMIKAILTLRYTESVREKEGGTYGVGVRSGLSHYPEAEGSVSISFDCDPDRRDDLIPLIYKEIDVLKKDGPTQVDLDKVKKNILKSRKEQKEKNSYVMGTIYNYYVNGVNNDLPENYEDIVNDMTIKEIKKISNKFFKKADKVEVVFYPKE